MPELRTLTEVNDEVTGTAHKAQVCSVCGKNINAHTFKGRVFRVEVRNEFDQYSSRHACFNCVKKTYTSRVKEIPREIERMENSIRELREQRQQIMEQLNIRDGSITNFKPITCASPDLNVREAD